MFQVFKFKVVFELFVYEKGMLEVKKQQYRNKDIGCIGLGCFLEWWFDDDFQSNWFGVLDIIIICCFDFEGVGICIEVSERYILVVIDIVLFVQEVFEFIGILIFFVGSIVQCCKFQCK